MPNQKAKKNKKQAKKTVVKVVVPKQKKKYTKPRAKKNMAMGSPSVGGFCPPTSMAATMRVKHQKSIILEGVDFLGTVSTTVAATDSRIINSWLINPLAMMPQSRLSQFAELWDKYSFLDLEIIAETVQGTNAAGTMCMCMDPDVTDDYNQLFGDTLIQRMTDAPVNASFPVWQPTSIKAAGRDFFSPVRYVDPASDSDPRLVYSGRLWVANIGPFGTGNFLRLYAKWRVKFSNPALDTSFAESTAIIQTANNTQISSTFPWGDFSTIIGTGLGYVASPSVVFRSDATLGSVIQFQAPGFYLIAINRTGTAMGVGAFSSAVLNGCSYTTTPSMPGINNPYNFAQVGTGNTSSTWTVIVEANRLGATISSTADAGVTHTFGGVFVVRFGNSFTRSNVPAPVTPAALNSRIAELETKLRVLTIPSPAAAIYPSSVFSATSTESVVEAPNIAAGTQNTFTVSSTTDVDQTGDLVTVTPGLMKMLEEEGYLLIPPERKTKRGSAIKHQNEDRPNLNGN